MPRLINPGTGTVISCGDNLAADYLARGWADADAPAHEVQTTPEQSANPKRGRPRKAQ